MYNMFSRCSSLKKENFTTKMRLSHILPKDQNENKISILNTKNKRQSKNLRYKFQKLRTFQYDIDLNEKKKISPKHTIHISNIISIKIR